MMTVRRGLHRLLGALGLVFAALLLAFAYLGYLGGNPFTLVRPAGEGRQDVAAVILSGDMGFRVGIAPQIAARLAADGIPVVGVNSLNFFRTTRTPEEASALIEAAMRQAQAFGRPRKLILIGQSFGADMLHVGLAGLPTPLRRQIAIVALVVPGATVEYRASPGEMFTFMIAEPDALPTARRIDWAPLLCIGGQEEAASLCPLLHRPNVHVVLLPGGHPLHYDSAAVYRQISAEMARAGVAAHGAA